MAEVIKTDGWANLLMGFGIRGRDPMADTRYRRDKVKLTRGELEEIYEGDGVGRKIVDVPADDMTREWFDIEGDVEEEVNGLLLPTGARQALADGIRWGRLYGGAVIVALVDDGRELFEPVDFARIREVVGWRVYDRHQVWWSSADLIADDTSASFGDPEFYRITPYRGGQFLAHHSRVVRLFGDPLPPRREEEEQGWGQSVIMAGYDQLRRLGIGEAASSSVLRDFIQPTLSVEGLQDMIAGGQEDLVRRRLDLIDMSRSVLNMTLLDSRETYTKHASSVAGMPDLLDRLMMMVSAVYSIPVTKLFGRSAAGLNATGEEDTRSYYDHLSREQEDKLSKPAKWMADLASYAIRGEEAGQIQWRSLWQMSDDQRSQIHQRQAQADAAYIDRGVLAPHEVAISRFGGDHYSIETRLEDDDPASRAGAMVEEDPPEADE